MGESFKLNITCGKCGINLAPGKVVLTYLNSTFPVDLYKCSGCGLVYIPEDLATGKMDMAEKALEDK